MNSVTDKLTDGLFEGKLVVDKTYGYAVHGCLLCCPEYTDLVVLPNPLNLAVGGLDSPTAQGKNICTGKEQQATVLDWNTVNQGVATGSTTQVDGVGAGSTTYFASVKVLAQNPKGECGWTSEQSSPGAVNVAPTITNISPAQGLVGAATNVTITGTGFASGATIQAGPNITVSGTSVKSATEVPRPSLLRTHSTQAVAGTSPRPPAGKPATARPSSCSCQRC